MSRRTYSSKHPMNPRQNRSVQIERLEARMLLAMDTVDAAFTVLEELDNGTLPAEYVLEKHQSTGPGTVTAAPILATPITVRTALPNQVTAKKVALSALGTDDGGERNLRYQWELTLKPEGSVARFSKSDSNAAKNTELFFDRVGNYTIKLSVIDNQGDSIVTTQNVTVVPLLSGFTGTFNGSILKNNSTLKAQAVSQTFGVSAIDQFGRPMDVPANAVHALTSKPNGSNAQLTVNQEQVKVDFDRIGKYQYQVTSAEKKVFKVKFDVTLNVASLEIVTPKTQLVLGESIKLSVKGTDQFGNPTERLPSAIWSASQGAKVTSSGQLTAPNSEGSITVSANIGQLTAQVTLRVGQAANTGGLNSLVQSYFADGSISRADMIAILRSVSSDGRVEADELSQLRTLVSSSGTYNIPNHVSVLASNVVNSSPANLYFQGTTLGNLSTGNTGPQLDKLVNKWFLGLDRPAILAHSGVGTISYATASGQLFNSTPLLTDQRQGLVGDCYLIASLGSIAKADPNAIRNMFIDNNDGTFTVRFYSGTLSYASDGFASGTGVADYVTVDLKLPAYSGASYFAYSNLGLSIASSTTPLWIALAEKAYAQWNETGRAGQNGTNTYSGIEGGWMGITYAQILGYNSSNFSVANASAKSTLISRLNGGHAVTVGTNSGSTALVGGHAYTVSGYDATTDRFTLFNPWGNNHPSPLTWAQIQANCDWFASINPSSSTPSVQTAGHQLALTQIAYVSRGGDALAIANFVLDTTQSGNNNLTNLDHSHNASLEMNHEAHTIAITEVFTPENDSDNDSRANEPTVRDLVHMEIFADIDALLAEILS